MEKKLKAVLCLVFFYSFTSLRVSSSKVKREVSNCGKRSQSRGFIVGGSNFERGDFPWMAALMFRADDKPPEYFCGGTLISENQVVTGEQCEVEKFERLSSFAIPLKLATA
jgi:secreted trypsin-like serine protease